MEKVTESKWIKLYCVEEERNSLKCHVENSSCKKVWKNVKTYAYKLIEAHLYYDHNIRNHVSDEESVKIWKYVTGTRNPKILLCKCGCIFNYTKTIETTLRCHIGRKHPKIIRAIRKEYGKVLEYYEEKKTGRGSVYLQCDKCHKKFRIFAGISKLRFHLSMCRGTLIFEESIAGMSRQPEGAGTVYQTMDLQTQEPTPSTSSKPSQQPQEPNAGPSSQICTHWQPQQTDVTTIYSEENVPSTSRRMGTNQQTEELIASTSSQTPIQSAEDIITTFYESEIYRDKIQEEFCPCKSGWYLNECPDCNSD